MSIRTTLVLLVVLVALGVYVFWSGTDTDQPDPDGVIDTATDTISVLDLDPATIRAITVTETDGETVQLEQEEGEWIIAMPALGPADSQRVEWVVDDLANLKATRIITPTDADLSPYGLDAPQHTITLAGEEGVLARLQLGDVNPGGNAVYVQRDDDPTIYLVSDFTFDSARRWLTTPPLPPTPTAEPSPTPTVEPSPTPTVETTLTPTARPRRTPTPSATPSPAAE